MLAGERTFVTSSSSIFIVSRDMSQCVRSDILCHINEDLEEEKVKGDKNKAPKYSFEILCLGQTIVSSGSTAWKSRLQQCKTGFPGLDRPPESSLPLGKNNS